MELLVSSKDFRLTRFQIVAAAVGLPSLPVRVVTPDDAVVAATPFQTLPILVTPGGPLARSAAILRYLTSLKEDEQLSGFTPLEDAQVSSWLDWARSSMEIPVLVLTAGAKDAKADAVAAAKARVVAGLGALDAYLASRTFLAGERLSLAEVSLIPTLHAVWANAAVVEPALRDKLTHLSRWYHTCMAQPAFAGVLGAPAVAAAASPAAAAASSPAGGATGGAGAAPSSRPSGTMFLPSALTSRDTFLPAERFTRARVRLGDLLLQGATAIGSTVTVCGWARTVREADKGALQFVALNDGSSFDSLQVICSRGKTAGFETVAAAGGTGASFRVSGTVVKSPAKGQEIELDALEVEVLGKVVDAATYPMSKKKHTLEYLRELQHLRPRTNTIGAVARIRNACAYATHRFFQDRGFLYVHTPIITGSDCEGAGEMFQVTTLVPSDPKADLPRLSEKDAKKAGKPDTKGDVDYRKDFFGKPVSLTVSGQLQVEAFTCALSDTYTFGPTFRAENSHTSRHLAEFWMIEPEIAFATLADDMALAEDYLKFCTQYVLDHCAGDLAFFEATFEKGLKARLENVVNEPFQRLTYTEAIELLISPEHAAAGKFEVTPYWGIDLASEHERYLTEKVFKKPVILINYPKDIKAFYMKVNPDGKTVAAMDVLVPKVGEIIGGSQREDDFETLRARMAEMKVAEEPLKWYMDLRKYGTVPHAGFGLGFERLVMYVTGLENIRDAIPFPRFPGNCML